MLAVHCETWILCQNFMPFNVQIKKDQLYKVLLVEDYLIFS